MSATQEIARRRTFAIISHPDAGKTTLTEKLLWFGGAIQVAGEIRARKAARHATSDWMELEKQRGISVTSSVMQFPYRECVINLLDTPGHEDFSEDTYRTLTAVDSAVMVIDSVNGVEAQTIKLLAVCRLRDTPIVTFINKLDREGREPIELLDEIESVLGIQCAPMTWPIGMGKRFRGVYHLYNDSIQFFDPQAEKGTSEIIQGLDNPRLDEVIGDQADELRMDIELVRGASHTFDREAYLAGKQCPVFFGSAVNNFGVQSLLDAVVDLSPAPLARPSKSRQVQPDEPKFSGFVFKIQANMDPKHRDRIAFLRVCSGRFDRGMKVKQVATGKTLSLQATAPALWPRHEPLLPIAVVGAHLSGLPLNGQLIERGATLIEATTTAPRYRLHALPGTVPPKPGLVRDEAAGHAIALEVWAMPQSAVGSFLALIPAPLGLGSIELADGRRVHGFLCEAHAVAEAPDVSGFGGWRTYLASLH